MFQNGVTKIYIQGVKYIIGQLSKFYVFDFFLNGTYIFGYHLQIPCKLIYKIVPIT